MQKEIQALVAAFYNDQKQETEFLQSILAAIAVSGAARKIMIRDIANAVARTESTGASDGPFSSYEGDVANAIHSIRTRAA